MSMPATSADIMPSLQLRNVALRLSILIFFRSITSGSLVSLLVVSSLLGKMSKLAVPRLSMKRLAVASSSTT